MERFFLLSLLWLDSEGGGMKRYTPFVSTLYSDVPNRRTPRLLISENFATPPPDVYCDPPFIFLSLCLRHADFQKR